MFIINKMTIRKNTITLLLILLVYGWFYVSQNIIKPHGENVIGANSNISVFVQPESGETPIVNAINNAKSEALVEVYLLSDKKVIESLINAKKRGVNVKVMLENHPFGGGNINNITKIELDAAGISTEWSNPKYSLTHEKAIVIDKNLLFVLSQNLTTSAFSKNREYDILDANSEDVLFARDIFVADWQRQSLTISKSHLIESPDTSRAALESLISNAQKSIDIEMEVVEDNEIIDLLSQKAKNATVRILAPPISQLKANQKALQKLKQAGVMVKTLSSPYIHAKLILSDRSKAYIGSVNFSTQSMDSNRELGIILSDANITKVLANTFESDWTKGIDF